MIKKIIKSIIDMPKTLYVNFKCFEFKDAIKLPLKVSYKVKIGKLKKNSIKFNCPIKKGMVKLGYNGSGFVSENNTYLSINNGTLVLNNNVTIAEGFSIFIDNGYVEIGEHFYSNRNFQIQSEEKIIIGKDCLVGWNVSLRDTDGHKIYHNKKMSNEKGNININNHVWIASNCSILKNSCISKGSIIGCNSLVHGINMTEDNCIIAGTPAKVIKKQVSWKE